MKYTIELTDTEYNILTGFMNMINSEIQTYYFQNTELVPIKIRTTNLEDTNEYQIGYKVGFEDGTKRNLQGYYNKALDDVDDALTVLENMTETEREEWFEDYASVGEVIHECTIQRIIKSTKEYEEKKKAEEIKVGDVVKFNEKCHSYDHVKSREFLVLHIFDNGLVTLLYDNGDTGATEISLLDKTGKHVDEVEQLLSKLEAN